MLARGREMTSKRALIVDDSKSARFALKRMLKALKLEVDTVESAADAMAYLDEHLPDVIFMDHMMPGMDGFEAVKRIKNNPQTAIVPIMMYTSKGGDVYLSEARALGAVGIIRKTIAPVELKESLLELGLIDDTPHKSSLKIDEAPKNKTSDAIRQEIPLQKENVLDTYIKDLHKLMDDQTIELHRSMWLGVESVSNEIFNRLNSDLEEKIEKIQAVPRKEDVDSFSIYNNKTLWSVLIVSVLLIISVLINFTLISNIDRLESKLASFEIEQSPFRQNSQILKEVSNAGNKISDNHQAREEFTKWALNKVIEYPFDEVALNDKRLAKIEELIQKALKAKFKGRIILQTHAGNFCLKSDQMGNYKLADNNLSIDDCTLIGNYIQPDDEPTSHQSLSFVNYLSDTNLLNEQGIAIEVVSLTRKLALSKYPKRSPQTTADKWNQAAQLNNRITVMLESDGNDFM